MNDMLVLTEEKDSDCMITFFIRAGEHECTDPPSVFMDGITVGRIGREPVQPSMPTSVTPTQYTFTTLTDDVEPLENKIDDLQTEVGHFPMMVRAIM